MAHGVHGFTRVFAVDLGIEAGDIAHGPLKLVSDRIQNEKLFFAMPFGARFL